jgi:hypothetical protein
VNRPAYLSRHEVARQEGVSVMTITRKVQAGAMSTLVLRPNLWRIEARALDRDAPAAVPGDLPPLVTAQWMAGHWRVHPRTIHRLIHDRRLPAVLVSGQWGMARRDWIRWVQDHTRGEDLP